MGVDQLQVAPEPDDTSDKISVIPKQDLSLLWAMMDAAMLEEDGIEMYPVPLTLSCQQAQFSDASAVLRK